MALSKRELFPDPADMPLCQAYLAAGTCSKGDTCKLIHGEFCEVRGALGAGWTGILKLQGRVALDYEPGRVGWHLQVETNRGDSLPVPVVEETAEATAQLVPWCAL